MGVRGVGIIEIITELQDLKRYNQNEKKKCAFFVSQLLFDPNFSI